MRIFFSLNELFKFGRVVSEKGDSLHGPFQIYLYRVLTPKKTLKLTKLRFYERHGDEVKFRINAHFFSRRFSQVWRKL
jgi:hypothetical protein